MAESSTDPLEGWFCTFCGRPKSTVKHLLVFPVRSPGESQGRLLPEQVAVRAKLTLCDGCVQAGLEALKHARPQESEPASQYPDTEPSCHACAMPERTVGPLYKRPMASVCSECLMACVEFMAELKGS